MIENKNERTHAKPNNEFKQLIAAFDSYYLTKVGVPYNYQPKDFRNLKQLIAKIKKIDTSGNTIDSFKVFLEAIKSPWHLDNLSIPLINSHFQKLYVDAIKFSPEATRQRMEKSYEYFKATEAAKPEPPKPKPTQYKWTEAEMSNFYKAQRVN